MFLKGMLVKRKDGRKFVNGHHVCSVKRVENNIVYLFEGGWVFKKSLEHVPVMAKAQDKEEKYTYVWAIL